MSLISVRNFIAPFTNGVNLVTIVVVALLFGIYRFAGGGIKVTSREARAPARIEAPAQPAVGRLSDSEEVESVAPQVPVPQRQQARPNKDAVISDILSAESSKSRQARNPSQEGKAGSLDEIEKQLGLR